MAKKFTNPFHRPRAASEQAVVDNVLVGDDGVMRADEEVANVDDVMRKYDRESNTRVWEGVPKVIVSVLMAAFSIYCICMTLFSTALAETKLSLFLGFIILIGFIIYPANKKHVRPNHIPWYDIVLAVVGAACFFYFAANALTIIKLVTRIQPMHVIMGVIGILVLAELCRRCVGIPILVVVGALLIYAFYNQLSYNADLYQGLRTIIYRLFYTTNGVIGTPVNVCFTYIVLFIIFGAFLERTGIAAFFISFANRIAGWSSGGAAKVSVISSALCGMVSGSSVGNTVTTGSITIPMMKKTGYKPEFAGAVEAASSTGGQIMPPIMGAAAFLMAEYMGLPYIEVAAKAILPAILYFAGIFITVHLEAKKLGLKGIPKSELPKWSYLAKNCYLVLPLVLLVWLVATGARTMATSAAISIMGAFIIGFINFLLTSLREREAGKSVMSVIVDTTTGARTMATSAAISIMGAFIIGFINFLLTSLREREAGKSVMSVIVDTTKFSLATAFEALQAGAKSAVSVAVACAMAGLIAGCITVTGLASILINAIVNVAGGAIILGLVLTMLCCIVGPHRRLHHRDRPGLHPHQRHRERGRRRHHPGPRAHHALLHRARHGRAYHGQLLHHGLHLRSHPHGARPAGRGGPLLRVLLRHRGRHHAARGLGGLCGQRHSQVEPHEDCHQRHQAGYRGVHRALHLRLQPHHAARGRLHVARVRPGCALGLRRPVRCGRGAQRLLVPPGHAGAAVGPYRGRPGHDDPGYPDRRRGLCSHRRNRGPAVPGPQTDRPKGRSRARRCAAGVGEPAA